MTAPSLTTTAPTSGFGVVRPRPPSASSIARARWMWSVCSSVVKALRRILTGESTPAQSADGDLGTQAIVREGIRVVREIERELADRPGTRADAVQDVAAALQGAVVGDRSRHGVRLAQRPSHLRRAGEHVAVAAARVAVEHAGTERALVVLELDPPAAVVRREPLLPATAAVGEA